jgi:arylsulfatase A-like enzyme/Tfp pilus assembly protein PilF
MIGGVSIWVIRGKVTSIKIRNVLLISIDTCRADHLSCYGYSRNTTPNIDAIAKDGILFENTTSPVPLTCPAHSSMLTGTIPPRHGVHDNTDYKLDDSFETLAEVLQQQGLATGAVISAFVLDSRYGLDQGFTVYEDNFAGNPNEPGISEKKGDETTNLAISQLEQYRDEKFFLFLHYYDPHYAWDPPEPFKSAYANDPYAGEIAFVDHCIGKVIDKLKSLGLYDSTLIIITSDHGEGLKEHGELTHGYYIYQSTIKVPLIIKMPGGPIGLRVKANAGLIDIVPTVCSSLGIQIPSQVQGQDLNELLKNGDVEDQRPYYCGSLLPTQYDCNPLLGVIKNNFKYIQTTRPELYDLKNDPKELDNLVKQRPQRVRIMQDQLTLIMEDREAKESTDSKLSHDAQSIARLESLGYITGASIDDSFEFDENKDDPKDLIEFHLLNSAAAAKLEEGKTSELTELCNKMISIKPDHVMAYHFLGKSALANGQYEEAFKYYSKHVELDPQAYGAYCNLGVSLVHLNRLEEAIEFFNRSIRISPDILPEAYENLSHALRNLGRFDEAIDQIQKGIEIFDGNENLKKELQKVLLSRGKFDAAAEEIKNNPDSAEAHYDMAKIFYRQKKLDLTVEHCRKALKLKPDHFKARNSLAGTLLELKQLGPALEQYYILLQIDPNSDKVLNSIAWILATTADPKISNPAEAEKLAQRACELTQYKVPGTIDTLAAAYAAAGKFIQAIETAQKAIELARSADRKDLAEEIKKRQELYRQNRPYHEP